MICHRKSLLQGAGLFLKETNYWKWHVLCKIKQRSRRRKKTIVDLRFLTSWTIDIFLCMKTFLKMGVIYIYNYKTPCGCWVQIFVAPDKVVFSASYSKNELVKKLKFNVFNDFHYKSKTLAEESRYTFSLTRVALICSCGRRWLKWWPL